MVFIGSKLTILSYGGPKMEQKTIRTFLTKDKAKVHFKALKVRVQVLISLAPFQKVHHSDFIWLERRQNEKSSHVDSSILSCTQFLLLLRNKHRPVSNSNIHRV